MVAGTCIFLSGITKDSPSPVLHIIDLTQTLLLDSTDVVSAAGEQLSVGRHLAKVILLDDEYY